MIQLHNFEELFQAIKQDSPEDAQQLFPRIRSAPDLQLLVATLGVVKEGSAKLPTHNDADVTKTATLFSSQNSGGQNETRASLRQESTAPTSGHRPLSSMIDSPWGLYPFEIPDASATKRAVDAFCGCAGKLFHVFSVEQCADFQKEVFASNRNSTDSPSVLLVRWLPLEFSTSTKLQLSRKKHSMLSLDIILNTSWK